MKKALAIYGDGFHAALPLHASIGGAMEKGMWLCSSRGITAKCFLIRIFLSILRISLTDSSTHEMKKFFVLLALCSACWYSAPAEELWTEKLVSRFSQRWDEIHRTLGEVNGKLDVLPDVPLLEPGGTGGYLTYDWAGPELNIHVQWDSPAQVDRVALVPARRYDANGLAPEFGLPNFFEIELLDEHENVVCLVGREQAAASRPVQKGLPFVYSLNAPVQAHGVRIRCRQPKTERFSAGELPAVAFAELFCFEGKRNVALGAQISVAEDRSEYKHWHWRPDFLVDGQTPLGLPEIPVRVSDHIGWVSKSRKTAVDGAMVEIDLKKPTAFNGIRFFPTQRVPHENVPGFALPQRFRVLTYEPGNEEPTRIIFDHTETGLPNPGNNPVEFRFPETVAQRVRISCPMVWKAFESYPAFLAFSEIQLLHAETNVAVGVSVSSSDQIGVVPAHGNLLWSEQSLTDGCGPVGTLIPQREWLELLNERYQLEVQRKGLGLESEKLLSAWRQRLQRMAWGIGVAAVLGVIVLPLYFRFRERRRLLSMRRRIAGDLHDEVGSNLGSVQILAEIAQQRNNIEELPKIRQIAAETLTAVRDIVWLLRPRRIEQVGLVSHLRESTAIMLDSLEWTFDSGGLDNTILLDDEGRSNLLLFYREALHNLVRHAQASKATIRLRRDHGVLTLEMADNGCGISREHLEKPVTLRALKQRAERLCGKLEVASDPGGGTRLILRIPIKVRGDQGGKGHG